MKIQNCRNFTVQIRSANDSIVGTGFVISQDGRIVTCLHVVRDAARTRDIKLGLEINVYFAQAARDEEKAHTARVIGLPDGYDDDIAVLQIDVDFLPAGVEVARVGEAETSDGHTFVSFGYRRLSHYQGLPARGMILGLGEPPQNYRLVTDPVILQSQQINDGMSGSAVLDIERDLVVGVIAQQWQAEKSYRDRDTGIAVDTQVLSLFAMNAELSEATPIRLKSEDLDIPLKRNQTVNLPRTNLENAPPLLSEWVGREDLLAGLNQDYLDPTCNITGLIGFGGEGKSSVARHWIEGVIKQPNLPKPDGVFWWGFYEQRSVDEFYEKAIAFLLKDVAHLQTKSTDKSQRVQAALLMLDGIDVEELDTIDQTRLIRGILRTGRYIFIIDGMELYQNQEGDNYGLLQSNKLRDFLTLFAEGVNQSFCVVTSRAPLLDFIAYKTNVERYVERLSDADGQKLLKKIGVRGTDDQLQRVVHEWDGYAIVLRLLGSYSVDICKGDVKSILNVPPPNDDEGHYERVQRVVAEYDKHLSVAEQEFLLIFSAFRIPVAPSAFVPVFWGRDPAWIPPRKRQPVGWERRLIKLFKWIKKLLGLSRSDKDSHRKNLSLRLHELNYEDFFELVERLTKYQLIKRFLDADFQAEKNETEKIKGTDKIFYSMHPLAHAYYGREFENPGNRIAKDTHERIADYYSRIMPPILSIKKPKLEQFSLHVESVYHLCKIGAYKKAYFIYYSDIQREYEWLLNLKMQAWNTSKKILENFFVVKNGSYLVKEFVDERIRGFVYNDFALCLNSLGNPRKAIPLYEKSIVKNVHLDFSLYNASSYSHMADSYKELGEIALAFNCVEKGLELTNNIESIELSERHRHENLIRKKVILFYLKGDIESALSNLVNQSHFDVFLYGANKRREKDWEKLLQLSKEQIELRDGIYDLHRYIPWKSNLALSLLMTHSNSEIAEQHLREALEKARSIDNHLCLTETLCAHGHFFGRYKQEPEKSYPYLEESLQYTLESGYRLCEADIRVGLAWAHLNSGKPEDARREANRAKKMSQEMGYHWGQVDADEVLATL
ncbi:MAG: hypothetical protein F6J87_09810 [Spirulina sp. SIO3F2]|nr:hypothetical protein [Spirulina sp. SIO3F2]